MPDGRIDGWPDRETDKSDFIGRCPTNVECPTETFVLFSAENLKNLMLKGLI